MPYALCPHVCYTHPMTSATVYTVAQVAAYLRESLEADPFLGDLWVSGEVSNLTRSAAGHMYFTLKDAQNQLRCVMFRAPRGGDRGASLLRNGDAFILHGKVSLYPARGELQVQVDLVQPSGAGALQLEYERLKARLEEEGLFDPSRKRPLPHFPRRIGVVTSPTGAVFHDICNVLGRRYPLAEVVLAPALVQGSGAAPEIVGGLRSLNDLGDIDVIIVARGGGSLEELWPFHEEAVARAIYASAAPVISGVGHETDVTIADLVADVRAPTPSAAAEIAVPDAAQLRRQVAAFQQAALGSLERALDQRRQLVEALAGQLRRSSPPVHTFQQRVDDLTQALGRGLSQSLALSRERFLGLEPRLRALDPLAVLDRGYAYVQLAESGAPVSRVAQVHPGDALKVTVSDGAFPAQAV
ncbi:MAG: exodeoxyribonuclease VII large subunit [Chloroflexi bacterium]|nr:exodeoxyribonuclease VII large subunit [Chloroflexota bacterium]